MIINNIPNYALNTEISYKSYNPIETRNIQILSTNDMTQYKSFKNFYETKRNSFMKNNILNEIEAMKEKNSINEIDYLTLLVISGNEYERSLNEMSEISNTLSEEDITDILSTRKFISVYKHILEIFSYLLNFTYFDWNKFKEKLNLHEIKFKMENVNFTTYSKRMINSFLSKISKNNKFAGAGNGSTKITGIKGYDKIFSWIKAVLKVYLFRVQNSKNILKGNSSSLTSNALSPFNKSDLIGVGKNLNLNQSEKKIKITNTKLKPPKIKNINIKNEFFFTGVNSPSSGHLKPDSNLNSNLFKKEKINIPNQSLPPKKLPKLKIKDKNLKMNFNILEERIDREKKALKSLPFMKNKTFHQLRKYFDLLKIEQFVINHKHFEEIKKVSLKNPENMKKIMNYLSTNKMKEIDEETLKAFIENINKKEEEIKLRK